MVRQKTIHSDENRALTGWLRFCRERKGLTVRQLGEQLGIHHSIVSKIENNERRLDVIEFIKYCKTLGVDPLKGIKVALERMD